MTIEYFDDSDEDLINIIFEYLKNKKENTSIEEIKNQLDKESFNKLCDLVKEENKGYFSLEYFRNEDEKNKLEFEYLYKNTIIVNRYKVVNKKYSFLKNHLMNILNVFQAITFYCIEYNFAGEEIVNILFENYDIPHAICDGLEELFNSNQYNLKLNYIINKLS